MPQPQSQRVTMKGLSIGSHWKKVTSKNHRPILANRSSSSLSSVFVKREHQSWRSKSGKSTNLSLAYSSDSSEVRETREEYVSQKEDRDSSNCLGITHAPCERRKAIPRAESSTMAKTRKPTEVHTTDNNHVIPTHSIVSKTTCAMEDVGKSAVEFETFVTSRVDQALSPMEDKIETLLLDVGKLANRPKPEPCTMKAITSTASQSNKSETVSETKASFSEVFASLVGSLFHDEPVPGAVITVTSSLSVSESSVATQDTSISSQDTSWDENDEVESKKKFGLPTYTEFIEALLGDESIPDDPRGDIPTSIQIYRVN